jgi:hypothetical protein
MRRAHSKSWGIGIGLVLAASILAGCASFVAAGPIPSPVFNTEAALGIVTATGRAATPATSDPPIGATLAATQARLPTAGATVTPPHKPLASFTPATPCASQG